MHIIYLAFGCLSIEFTNTTAQLFTFTKWKFYYNFFVLKFHFGAFIHNFINERNVFFFSLYVFAQSMSLMCWQMQLHIIFFAVSSIFRHLHGDIMLHAHNSMHEMNINACFWHLIHYCVFLLKMIFPNEYETYLQNTRLGKLQRTMEILIYYRQTTW